MVGLFHGKSHLQMDDEQGYPYFRLPLHISGINPSQKGVHRVWLWTPPRHFKTPLPFILVSNCGYNPLIKGITLLRRLTITRITKLDDPPSSY